MSLLPSCEPLALDNADVQSASRNTCEEDAECRLGSCNSARGRCVARRTQLQRILLEILPPSSDERFGGRRFLQMVDPTAEDTPEVLQLLRPAVVQGNVRLTGDNNSDLNNCDRGRQLTITFVPVERHLGLDVVTYRVTSDYRYNEPTAITAHTYRINGLPEGVYDVSWEYARKALATPKDVCRVVPRLQRRVRVERVNGQVPPLDLASPPTRSLTVLLPWDDAFDGWRVDVIHPTTSESLSTVGVFSKENLQPSADGNSILGSVLIHLGTVVGSDYVEPKQERLRLQPPASEEKRPTVLLFLKGLELFDTGVVQVPAFSPFKTLVNYQTWVWKEDSPEKPVAGVATFNAVSLTDLPEGNAQLKLRVDIADDGKVEAELPPGEYALRVVPRKPESEEEETALSSFNASLEIWPPVDFSNPEATTPGGTQSGRVVSVPVARTLSGKVVLPTSNGSPRDTVVEARGVPNTGVGSTQAPVPRSVKTLITSSRGNFAVSDADCGSCDGSGAAAFDLRVKPPASSGFPWLVRPNVEVFDDVSLGELAVDAPYIYERKLEFPVPGNSDGSFPNALVRAYALLDKSGVPILNEILETCDALLLQGPERANDRCIARAVQIAETRSGADGRFQVLLPSQLDIPPD